MSLKKLTAESILRFFTICPPAYRFYIGKKQGQFNNNPIVVYSDCKCGTSSLHKSILAQGMFPAFHTHILSPERTDPSKIFPVNGPRAIKKAFVEHFPDVKFISLVRNPLEREISWFFHNYFKVERTPEESSPAQLAKTFISQRPDSDLYDWFADEMYPFTGFNIYDQHFPIETGYATYSHEKYKILVLKIELENEVKEKAIGSFLGHPNFKYKPLGHVGNKSPYAEQYSNFKKEARFPEEFISEVMNTRFARKFYSESEIKKVSDKWKIK